MTTPILTLKGKPSVLIEGNNARLRVPFVDSENPLTDEKGEPLQSTEIGLYQYPEFIEFVDIPSDATLDVALIEDLVSQALAQATPKAEMRASAGDIKAELLPIIDEFIEGNSETIKGLDMTGTLKEGLVNTVRKL